VYSPIYIRIPLILKMIPSCSEIQPTLGKEPKKKLIDYEKSRSNDYGTILPQRHAPTDFRVKKETFGMPTCYTLDRQLEEVAHRRYFLVNHTNDDGEKNKEQDLAEEKEEEDYIDFLFKVKRPVLRKSKSVINFSSRIYMNLTSKRKAVRRRYSDSDIPSRHKSCNKDASIIKNILGKSKIKRKCMSFL